MFRLPTEKELTERVGVSRSTICERLRILQASACSPAVTRPDRPSTSSQPSGQPLARIGRCCDHVCEEAQVDGPMREAPPSLNELRKRREAILQLARRHGARDVRVFGSVARGDAGKGSDIDFLVDMEAGRSLLDLGGLLMDLQDLLGGSVDVVTPASLRERVLTRVLQEAVTL